MLLAAIPDKISWSIQLAGRERCIDMLFDVMVEVAYERAHDFVRVGDPAVLVVLSNSPTLQSFKAVRDVYLPFSRLWLVDYPFVSRTGFQRAFLNLNHGRRQGGVGPGQDPRGGDGQQSERREYSGFAR